MNEDHRPWGYYKILSDEKTYKVKVIVVYPNQRLSLQRHQKRSEHWYVIKGRAKVTLDGFEITINVGESIDIPKFSWHRVMNSDNENLIFVEVQTGDYFGEDDIERKEDDYGRVKKHQVKKHSFPGKVVAQVRNFFKEKTKQKKESM